MPMLPRRVVPAVVLRTPTTAEIEESYEGQRRTDTEWAEGTEPPTHPHNTRVHEVTYAAYVDWELGGTGSRRLRYV